RAAVARREPLARFVAGFAPRPGAGLCGGYRRAVAPRVPRGRRAFLHPTRKSEVPCEGRDGGLVAGTASPAGAPAGDGGREPERFGRDACRAFAPAAASAVRAPA